MKKLIFFALLLVSTVARSQTDTSTSPLDKLSYDELGKYYLNEKEPIQFYKGPIEVGDSSYNILNPLTIPTKTVYADPLLHFYRGSIVTSEDQDTTVSIMQMMKPKVSLGVGRMGFYGDLYSKHFQSPLTARLAYNLDISQRLTRYLQLNFSVLFGKLAANEWTPTRQNNFQSEIRAGGVSLLYDFGNFIPDRFKVRPFISFGVMGFEFLSKTDQKDKNGNTYYYWTDGSIRNLPQSAPNAQNAKMLHRDYTYETDIRNNAGFGKYPERAWAFPIGAGAIMKVTDRIDVKMNFQFFFTTTDYIDGITSKSPGPFKGTRANDRFTYSSIALQYDLISIPKKHINPAADTLSNAFWLAFDKEDADKDGVPDMSDNCQGTPEGVAVDAKGCPLDDDQDGIPNYRDDEPATPAGTPVNARGVGQTDEYWARWYADYLNDSTSSYATTEYVGNFFAKTKKPKKEKKESFAVELARYKGAIPTEELAFLLSIGDINSTTLEDGTTVVYTAGNYDKIAAAIKRRDEFRADGNKNAGISRLTDNSIVPIPDQELEKLLQQEIKDLKELNINGKSDSTATGALAATQVSAAANTDESFAKDDVVYRVQLGAFKNKISTNVFNTSAGVLELKTGENIYRYVTKGYKTIEEAAAVRADLVVQGYSDAFVTSYKEGKRIALNKTKATVDKSYKEDLSEDKMFSSINKKLVTFKIQLGPLKRPAMEASMDEKVKSLSNVDKKPTATGTLRYTTGVFSNFDDAEKYRKELENKGFNDAFIIATFKNEIISIQEALELMK